MESVFCDTKKNLCGWFENDIPVMNPVLNKGSEYLCHTDIGM